MPATIAHLVPPSAPDHLIRMIETEIILGMTNCLSAHEIAERLASMLADHSAT